ncbi:isocitrate lyase/PEP mutase family protein [Mangrovihabitans endophyticus]|uniref:2-methylisocitrate lyase n=1 Tax=Mangrovihabitans endophyticus TaxID=1751298 RepID=A0A8J3BUF5_9ACTN|nr:isocitrate lyase/PEP mutase family protein [Mangrovihabitans endophyticus]GGK75620.1 2-methylisocitrate lyase [Mangrovihabitans endophyticus]
MTSAPASAVRALLGAGRLTHVPGVWDPASARLAVQAGHQAVLLSGAAVAATMLGRPDLGVAPATQIADRAATLGPALDGVPLLADADIGYEGPSSAVWTALAYQRAGIGALVLGDRQGAPTPGDRRGVAGAPLVEPRPAAERISALTGQAPDIAVIARTDAYPADGLAETVLRCRAYAAAGADAILPAGVDDPEHLGRLQAALPGVPLVLLRSESAGPARRWADEELAALGVRLVLHPLTAVLAAMRAASLAYHCIAETGDTDRVDRMPWAAFTALLPAEGAHPPAPMPVATVGPARSPGRPGPGGAHLPGPPDGPPRPQATGTGMPAGVERLDT